MSPDVSAEDLAAEAALALLAGDGGPSSGVTDPALVREMTEVLGLLPAALGGPAPSPELRGRVLEAARAEAARAGAELRTGPSGRPVEELTLRGAQRDALDMTLVRPRGVPSIELRPAQHEDPADVLRPAERVLGEDSTSGLRGLPSLGAAPPRDRRGNGLTLALAAMLGLCLVGLAYLAGRLNAREADLQRLAAELRENQVQTASLRAREVDFDRARRRLEMITTVAQSAYPLRPTGALPVAGAGQEPSGIVFVCGQHQQWYLSLKGLAEPPPGQHYELWFITDRGAARGGALEVRRGSPAEAEAPTMPAGTHGFAVTLEGDADGAEPAGPYVLLGDRSVPL